MTIVECADYASLAVFGYFCSIGGVGYPVLEETFRIVFHYLLLFLISHVHGFLIC